MKNENDIIRHNNITDSQSIKKTEQQIDDVINFLPYPILVIDNNGIVIAWNKNMETMTGIEAASIIGKGDYEYAIPFYGLRKKLLIDYVTETKEVIKEKYSNLKRQGQNFVAESYIPLLNNSKGAFVIETASTLYDSKGNISGAIEIINEVTEQKNAENELKKAKNKLELQTTDLIDIVEELRVSQEVIEDYNKELEKLSIIVRETDNAIMVMDAEGNFEWFNEGFTSLYGYTYEEFISQKSNNILQTVTTPAAKIAVKNCMKQKITTTFEALMVHKSGNRIWVQTTVTPILNSDKEIKKLIAIDSNITKLRDAETEIFEQKDEIEAQKRILQKERDKANKQKEKLTDSILYAKRIQVAILPPRSFVKELLPNHFILYKPKDIVSGDFYWITKRDNEIVIAAVDCTGHGVPGGFLSMLGISFLNQIVYKTNKETGIKLKASEILDRLRDSVIKSLHQSKHDDSSKDGMDISLCIINSDDLTLQFAGANNPIYHFKASANDTNYEFTKIKGDAMPIGIYHGNKKSFNNNTLQLQKNDTLYMFSDGYADQFGGENGRKFMSSKFKQMLLSIQEKSMDEQKKMLQYNLSEWTGRTNTENTKYHKYDQVDDILVIGIRI